MSPVELVLLAELHADGQPAMLAQLRRDPECARVLAALDMVTTALHLLRDTRAPPPSLLGSHGRRNTLD
ncbi:hypothetical protein [Rhodococcus maanshanensis]|uniref:hypothetical protein n=1 Tax=Rhodococcus maanshanensis TaxID=183556 RepID=UPI000B80747B|nr:hypothetical protein [Rhodococcus maanshanensis]